jgi:hypothetical protein
MEDGPSRRTEIWRIDQTTNIGKTDLSGFEYSREVTQRIAGVRTDLDRFSPGEIQVLENHGYLRAASSLAWLLSRVDNEDREEGSSDGSLLELLAKDTRPLVAPPHERALDERFALRALVGSDRRLMRAAWVRSLKRR